MKSPISVLWVSERGSKFIEPRNSERRIEDRRLRVKAADLRAEQPEPHAALGARQLYS